MNYDRKSGKNGRVEPKYFFFYLLDLDSRKLPGFDPPVAGLERPLSPADEGERATEKIWFWDECEERIGQCIRWVP